MKDRSALRELPLANNIQRHYEALSPVTNFFLADTLGDLQLRVRDDIHQSVQSLEGSDFKWAPAMVQQVERLKKGFFGFLKKEPPGTIYGPDNQNFIATSQKTRQAFLVWLEQAGVDFDNEAQGRWGETSHLRKIGPSIALMEGMHPILKRQTRIRSSAEEQKTPEHMEQALIAVRKIIEKNPRRGNIIYEHFPKNWDRFMVCLKHYHGNSVQARYFLNLSPETLDGFLTHQDRIAGLTRDIMKVNGTQKSSIFLESFPANPDKWNQFPEQVYDIPTAANFENTRLKILQGSHEARRHFFTEIDTLLQQGEHLAAYKLFGGVDPGRRVAADFLADDSHTILGDGRPENKETRVADQDSFKFVIPHETLTKSIHEYMQNGNISSLIYGANHFRSGNKFLSKERKGMYLEDFFDHIPKVGYMVVDIFGVEALMLEIQKTFEQK